MLYCLLCQVLREMFAYKPPVTKDQFFAPGFGECKVIMCTQVLQLVHSKHRSLVGISRSNSSRHRPNQTLPAATLNASSEVLQSYDALQRNSNMS